MGSLQDICRLCMTKLSGIAIECLQDDQILLRENIQTLYNVKITKSDECSTKICPSCYAIVLMSKVQYCKVIQTQFNIESALSLSKDLSPLVNVSSSDMKRGVKRRLFPPDEEVTEKKLKLAESVTVSTNPIKMEKDESPKKNPVVTSTNTASIVTSSNTVPEKIVAPKTIPVVTSSKTAPEKKVAPKAVSVVTSTNITLEKDVPSKTAAVDTILKTSPKKSLPSKDKPAAANIEKSNTPIPNQTPNTIWNNVDLTTPQYNHPSLFHRKQISYSSVLDSGKLDNTILPAADQRNEFADLNDRMKRHWDPTINCVDNNYSEDSDKMVVEDNDINNKIYENVISSKQSAANNIMETDNVLSKTIKYFTPVSFSIFDYLQKIEEVTKQMSQLKLDVLSNVHSNKLFAKLMY